MEVIINYWAILAAGVAYVAIGGVWYGPLFGKAWKQLIGFSDEDMQTMPLSPNKAMVLGLLASLLMAYILMHFLTYASVFNLDMSVMGGVMGAVWIWLGFFVPLALGSVLWEGKPWKLFLINASFYLVALIAMSAILFAWM